MTELATNVLDLIYLGPVQLEPRLEDTWK